MKFCRPREHSAESAFRLYKVLRLAGRARENPIAFNRRRSVAKYLQNLVAQRQGHARGVLALACRNRPGAKGETEFREAHLFTVPPTPSHQQSDQDKIADRFVFFCLERSKKILQFLSAQESLPLRLAVSWNPVREVLRLAACRVLIYRPSGECEQGTEQFTNTVGLRRMLASDLCV